MGFKKINSLKVSLFTHLVVALVFSIIFSFAVQNIAGHMKETIWLEYIDADELYEFQNKYSSQFGGMISVPQVMNSEMDKVDQFWVGVCEFMESWSVFILTFTSVYIALTIFYNRRLKKPLHILNSCAEKISQQELNFSVDYTKKDEMGQLCGAFEKMRKQLQLNNSEMWNMIEEQKQMRSAFSHDLRTPRNRQISRRIKKHLWLSNRSWARDVHSFGILHSWGALAGKSCSAQASSIWLIAGAFRRTQSK